MNANNHKGFEIVFNVEEKILRVRTWGEWDLDFSKRYALALQGKISELSSQWKIWYVLVDVSRFSAQSAEAGSIIGEQLTTIGTLGIKKIAYIHNGTNSQLPSNHRRDGPIQASFESMDEAVQWFIHK